MRILHFSGPSTQNKTKPKGTEQASNSSETQRDQHPASSSGDKKTSLNSAGNTSGLVSPQSKQEDILTISSKGHVDSSSDDGSGDRIARETLNIPDKLIEFFNSGADSSSNDSSLNTSRIFGFHDSRKNVNAQSPPKNGHQEPYNAQFQKHHEKRGFLGWLTKA